MPDEQMKANQKPEETPDPLKPADHFRIPKTPEEITELMEEMEKKHGPFVADEFERLR